MDYDLDEARIRKWNRTHIVDRAVSELQGLAAAVIFDGVVDNDEIVMLYKWLDQYREESNEWPLKELKQLIEDICSDGIVTSHEREVLFGFLKSFATGSDEKALVEDIYDDVEIIFPKMVFLFTGKLLFAPRRKAQEAVIERGGIASDSKTITNKINYLVCGDLGSPSYRQSRFGNKISKALEIKRDDNANIAIVQESQFVEAIMNN